MSAYMCVCIKSCQYLVFVHPGFSASMEDSIEVMLQERISKLLSYYRDNRVLAFVAGAIFSRIYGLWAMFCLPGIKVPFQLKVPFLPSTKEQTENVMRLLEGRQGQLADLGSGDGRLLSQNHTEILFPNIC